MGRELKKALFKFQPFSNKQLKILTWWCEGSPYKDYNGIICDGSIRSGKSLSMSLSFIIWAMETFNKQNFAMCGKTIHSFRKNVWFTLELMLKSRGYKIKERQSENMIIISKGDKLNYFYIYGGKDVASASLIQGITLAGLYLDEICLMHKDFINQATSRCSVKGSKYFMNCNPEGAFSYVKLEWIDKADEKKLLRLHFTMDDNLSLDEEIKARYEKMYTGVFYKRFILGEWVSCDGLVYDMFDTDRHIVHDIDDIDTSKGCYVSCDYGIQNPHVYLLWQKNKSGKWVATREYYYSGRDSNKSKTDSELADDLIRWLNGLNPMAIIVDPSASSFIAELRKRGFNVKKAKNDVIEGIRLVSELLNNDEILFYDVCKETFKEFSNYVWDENASERGEDKVVKQYDHCLDSVRYFCNTILNNKNKVKVGSKAKLGLR